MSQKAQRELRQGLLRLVQTTVPGFDGILGDGAGNVEVSGQSDDWYIRPIGTELPIIVKRGSAPKIEGIRVRVEPEFDGIGKKLKRGRMHVTGIVAAGGGNGTVNTGIEPHGLTHFAGETDPTYIDTVQIINGLCYAWSGLEITINAGWAIVNGQPVKFSNQTLSVAANVPDSGALYGLVRVNSSGVIDLQEGTPVANFADLLWTNVPAVADDYAALAIVRLYEGQTTLSRLYANPDVIDIRFAPMTAGGGGASELDDLSDVNAPSPNDGQVLTWDDGAGEWVADDAPGGEVAGEGNDILLMVAQQYRDEDVYLGVSSDGSEWRIMGKAVAEGGGTHATGKRSSSILYHGGAWYIVYDTGNDATAADTVGWYILKSYNLIDWAAHATIDMTAKVSGAEHMWAPEWFVNPNDDSVNIVGSINKSASEPAIEGFDLYIITADDANLDAWTGAATEITGTSLPDTMIDPCMVYFDGEYHIWCKDNNAGEECIVLLSSASIASGYTVTTNFKVAWDTPREAPCAVEIRDGVWRVYFDHYTQNGIYYSESTDGWSTWSTPALITTGGDFIVSHPTIIRVTERQALANIVGAFLQRGPASLEVGGAAQDATITINAGVGDSVQDANQKASLVFMLDDVEIARFKVDEADSEVVVDLTGKHLRLVSDAANAGGNLQIQCYTPGGSNEGIAYLAASEDYRFGLFFPGSDVVALGNRAADGVVQIRANSATAGVDGEIVVAQFEDDRILLLDPDVAHGITDQAPTTAYGTIQAQSGTAGGLALRGLSEATISANLQAYGTTDDTTKSTAGVAYAQVNSAKRSGTAAGDPGANANIFAVRSNGATRLIVDTEGDLHLDATSNINVWDEHDDIMLLSGLRASLLPDGHEVKERFADWIEQARPVLEKTGVITYNDDGHHFLNVSRMQMLMVDALRQLYERIERLEGKNETG